MPPVFGITAPKCPKCGKSVYVAEQVIGPQSKAYHKACLTCVVCNRRLDSTLLVEHDGQPLCRHCHRDSLGQGKGGFNLSVPLRASLPPPSPPKLSTPQRPSHPQELKQEEEELTARLTGIRIQPRQPATSPPPHIAYSPPLSSSSSSPPPARPNNPTPATALNPLASTSALSNSISPSSLPLPLDGDSSRVSQVESIDDYIAPSVGTPNIVPRSKAPGADGLRSEGISSTEEEDNRHSRYMAPSTSIPQAKPSGYSPPPPPQASSPSRPSGSRPLPQPPTIPTSATSTYNSGSATSSPLPSAVKNGHTSLPPASRRVPVSSTTPTFKTAPAPSSTYASTSNLTSSASYYTPTPTRLASAVSSGTPLCARCSRPVYHAEQVIAASGGRVWHRPCLRCEECGTTLQKGSLEEGPVGGSNGGERYGQGCNTFCRVCYRRLFGPRGIGHAGTSFPTAS